MDFAEHEHRPAKKTPAKQVSRTQSLPAEQEGDVVPSDQHAKHLYLPLIGIGAQTVSPEQTAAEKAWMADRTIPTSISIRKPQRKSPLLMAKASTEGQAAEGQNPKGSVPTVAPNQIAQTPQPTPNPQPSRVNHDRKPDPVPFIESNIPIIGRHQLWGTKGNDVIRVEPTQKPGIYEVTVTSVDKDSGKRKLVGKRLLTEDQLNRTDIHGGKGDDWFNGISGKLPPGTKFYGDAGDDFLARSPENRGIAFDGGKGNDTTFDEFNKSDREPNLRYKSQSDIEHDSPDESVHNFIRNVAENAEKRLANNSARLTSEQKGYENLNPSNRKWSQLRELAQQDQQLVAYKNRLTDQISALQIKDQQSSLSSTTPFLSPNTVSERPNTLPDLKNTYPIGVVNPQTQAKIEELQAQQKLITLAQRQRQAQYPALAVLDTAVVAKTENTLQGNQALLNTIGKGFGKIQGSIAELQDQILEDPERAMALDDVRDVTLQQYRSFLNTKDPIDQPKAEAIKGYLKNRELQKLGGDILTSGLTVGAVIGTILQPEAMWPLWVGAAGTAAGVTTGIRDYKEFSTVDLGAQAQEGGADSLTSKNKEEARFDLMMGQANLLMAGLDVGMTAKGTVELLKGSTKMGASLSKVKPAALAQVFNDVANGQLEKARAGLEAAGKFSKNEVDETLRWIQNLGSGNVRLAADGVPGGALDDVVDPKLPRRSQGVGPGSGEFKGVKPSRKKSLDHQPDGTPTEVNPNPKTYQEIENSRGLMRENESAKIMARNGYRVEQNPPPKSNGKNPDFKIEGVYADALSPATEKFQSVYRGIQDKVEKGQADIIVVNLQDAPKVDIQKLQEFLGQYPIPSLRQVFLIKEGKITKTINF
jgi:Contact-dependent growth inhibition CdiA C-terminal domain